MIKEFFGSFIEELWYVILLKQKVLAKRKEKMEKTKDPNKNMLPGPKLSLYHLSHPIKGLRYISN